MPQEIERKFLVKGEFRNRAIKSVRIRQGYLSSRPGITVRIRLKGEKGFLTIKGESNASGRSRYEWEKEIPGDEASELLQLCQPGLIDKTRYLVPAGDFIFEVDIFHSENEGLIMAELELKSESDSFPRPDWLGEEVTGDIRYYNSYLAKNPYTMWK